MNVKNNNAGGAVNTPLHLTTTITIKELIVMDKTILSKPCLDCKPFLDCREDQSQTHLKEQKICKRCGEIFIRPDNYSNQQWADREYCSRKCGAIKRDVNQDSKIISQYVDLRMSSVDIAKIVGFSDTHVRRILKKNNVRIRPASENKKLSNNKSEVKEKIRQSATGRKHSEYSKNKLRARVGSINHNWRNGITVSAQGYLQFTPSPANGEHASKMLHVVIAEWKYGRKVKKRGTRSPFGRE